MSFTFQIQTTENNQAFIFQADSATLSIDWGDTQTTTESTSTSGLRSHSYSTAGTYNISLTGTATRIAFYGNGATSTLLIDVLTKMSDGLTGITSASEMFRGCTQITTFTEPAFFDDVSVNVTTMAYMFFGALKFNGNISNWNTSSVKTMLQMFYQATSFNQPIGNWNTSSVETMASMFNGATSFNQDLNNWDTSSVTNMQQMFLGATNFNGNISNWNTSKVTNMQQTFYEATNFNGDISNWDTSNVTTMYLTFFRARAFNQPIGNWNTSKVTSMNSMFYQTNVFNQNLSGWDTSKVTDMYRMFYGALKFNGNISNWNTSKVTNMRQMFEGATDFNQDISNWNVSSVTIAIGMFNGVTLPTVVYDGILIKWSKQTLQSGVTISFGNSKYSNGLPLDSKNLIASNFTWTITDGGSTGDTYIEHKKTKIKYDFPNDMISYWTMDNINGTTLIDETGNNNGTIYGSTQVDGKIGKALSFDGVDDYVATSDFSWARTDNFTVSAWVKPTASVIATNNNGILGKMTYEWGFLHATSGLYFEYWTPTGSGRSLFISSTTKLTADVWSNIVISYNGSVGTLYVNGVAVKTAVSTADFRDVASTVDIGRSYSISGKNYFNGSIDEVLIFNRALTLDEINKIYTIGLNKFKLKSC